MRFPLSMRWLLAAIVLIVAAAVIIVSRAHQPRRLAPLVAEFSGGGATLALRRALLPAQTDMLRISVAPLALPASASLDAITAELSTALAYVSARTATTLSEPITITINTEANCTLHGVAYTQNREVQVFTCAAIPSDRVVAILAHELVHQLAHDYYGDAHLNSDPIVLEGWATWGAGHYWLSRHATFRDFLGGEAPLPLAANHLGRPVAEMNTLYYQWASFVEYLLVTYGREAFDRLYRSGNSTPGSADYQGVYGVDLATLEAAWQEWLR
ncbi:hypothetical protein [uncultured Chloroflexus sp.]|uniref:hypothetical protein n=1 Tax=uncultured Chloroflexus sp. TaxID=214040 RepID=UPI002604649F|nr:hypothetical protein [uncultured Chloroflexus sp.]